MHRSFKPLQPLATLHWRAEKWMQNKKHEDQGVFSRSESASDVDHRKQRISKSTGHCWADLQWRMYQFFNSHICQQIKAATSMCVCLWERTHTWWLETSLTYISKQQQQQQQQRSVCWVHRETHAAEIRSYVSRRSLMMMWLLVNMYSETAKSNKEQLAETSGNMYNLCHI